MNVHDNLAVISAAVPENEGFYKCAAFVESYKDYSYAFLTVCSPGQNDTLVTEL